MEQLVFLDESAANERNKDRKFEWGICGSFGSCLHSFQEVRVMECLACIYGGWLYSMRSQAGVL